MTRAMLPLLPCLLLASPAGAWDLGDGAGIDERAAELEKRWRPYSKTMVDLDIARRSVQDEEPDWVTREKEKMTPPERPFGRIHGFTLRQKDVRFLAVGRHGPFKSGGDQKSLLAAIRSSELGASAQLFASISSEPGQGWELVSSAPGRDARAVPSETDAAPLRVTWRYLDFYREGGKRPQVYVLVVADKPRTDLPPDAPRRRN